MMWNMYFPYKKLDAPDTPEYRRIARRYLWESTWRIMWGAGIFVVLMMTMLGLLMWQSDHSKFKSLVFFPWLASFFILSLSGVTNGRRLLAVFLDKGWELSEELISPDVRREFVSPLDPITSFDMCADFLSSIKCTEMLEAKKQLHFVYDPFRGVIHLGRYTPRFLGLGVRVEVQMQEGQATTITVSSRPGFSRFFIQDGEAYQWVVKVTAGLQKALQDKRHALEAAKREAALEKLALESKLAVLQAQVEPHFLFNTLANLKYLIRTDTDVAQDLLSHLVGYLQSAMPDMRTISSTVGKEFALAEHFLHIMQIRMGTRLQFFLACEDNVGDLAMPPAMLISLLENAIKHGLEKATRAGHIDISAVREKQHVVIAVVDDGVGLNDNAGEGVGLANIHQRLALLYGDAASLVVMPNQPQGVDARIYFPISHPTQG